MLFWELNVVKLITAGPTASKQGANLYREFHPDQANILYIKNDNPP
jgi:hypothetical protein